MRKQKNLRYFLRYARKGDVKIIDSINLSASIQKNFVQSVKELEDSSSVIIVVTRNWSRTEKIKNPRELINQAYQKDQNNNRSLVPKFIIKVFDFVIRTKRDLQPLLKPRTAPRHYTKLFHIANDDTERHQNTLIFLWR